MTRAASVRFRVLIRVWARLFGVQGSWNFETMQGLGFGVSLLPALRTLYRGDELRQRLQTYSRYFNTHPYMAPLIAGTVLKLETLSAKGEPVQVDGRAAVDMLVAPFAAMGDAFFWGGLRPLASALALIAAVQGSLWAMAIFFTLFAVPRLLISMMALALGYFQGIGMVNTIGRLNLADRAVNLKQLLALCLGALACFIGEKWVSSSEEDLWWVLIVAPLMVFLVFLLRRGVSPLALFLGLSAFYWLGTLFNLG